MPQISVLIVNYNSSGRLKKCLSCLDAQTFRDFEIIIVDNASTDNSVTEAKTSGVGAQYIDAGDNIGFAAANNLAAKTAAGQWLAFLNPDAYAEPGWLQEIMAAVARHPWADAFGSTQLMANDPSRIDGAGDAYSIFGVNYRSHFGRPVETLPQKDSECFTPCAAAAVYRRDVFESLNGFDEQFFCYGEDVDLGFRLRLSGGRAVQVRAAVVLHEGSGVTGKSSAFTVYHGHRNRIWLTYKNLPSALLAPLFPVHVAVNLCFLLWFLLRGVGPAYARALIDGYRGHFELKTQRRAVQAARKISSRELMQWFVWSPVKFIRREGRLRPVNA